MVKATSMKFFEFLHFLLMVTSPSASLVSSNEFLAHFKTEENGIFRAKDFRAKNLLSLLLFVVSTPPPLHFFCHLNSMSVDVRYLAPVLE